MSSFMVKTFLESSEEFFLEFDQQQFVNIGINSLGEAIADLTLTVRSDYCTTALSQAMEVLQNLSVDVETMCSFISDTTFSSRFVGMQYKIPDVTAEEPSSIKVDKLRDSAMSMENTIMRCSRGEVKQEKIDALLKSHDAWVRSTKKRCVIAPVSYDASFAKNAREITTAGIGMVLVTPEYALDAIVGQLQAFSENRAKLLKQLDAVNAAVGFCIEKCEASLRIVSETNANNAGDQKRISELSNIGYNRVRGMMEVLSFTVFTALNKLHFFTYKIKNIQKFYNALQMQFSEVKPLIECGAFSTPCEMEYREIAADLKNGDSYSFDQISNTVSELYQKDMPKIDAPSYTYSSVASIFSSIASDLIKVGDMVNDEVLAAAEILDNTELQQSLYDRYEPAIKDMCTVTPASTDMGVSYKMALAEIRGYHANCAQISEAIKECREAVDVVKRKLFSMAGGVDNDIDDIREVVDSAEEDINKLVRLAADCCYTRIQNLTRYVDECRCSLEKGECEPPAIQESVDFTAFGIEESIHILREQTDLFMAILSEQYYQARILKDYGIKLVLEDGDSPAPQASGDNNNSSSGGTGNNGDGGKQSTAPQVTNDTVDTTSKNSVSDKGISKGKLSGVLDAIKNFFANLISRFKEVLNKTKYQNGQWIANHKDAILTRDYSSITIEILPYADMTPDTIMKNLNTVRDNVRAMNASKAQTIKNREEMRKAICTFDINFDQDGLNEGAVATNYNKVGNQALEKKSYSNDGVKSLVANSIIPYCETYYDEFSNNITARIDEISNAVADVTKTYVNESVMELRAGGNIFIEADTDNNNQQQQNNTTSGASEKAKWLQAITRTYCGAVLNAIRDRANDYFALLGSICPKDNVTNAKPESDGNGDESTDNNG